QISFTTRSEDDRSSGGIDRLPPRFDAFDCEFQTVKRLVDVVPSVLNREPGDTGSDTKRNALRDTLRLVSVPVLKIGVDRKARRLNKLSIMCEHLVARMRGGVVRQATTESKTGGGSRQRFESEVFEINCAADVPRIRQNEAARFV